MPVVVVYIYEGRTLDQKRELVRGVSDAVMKVTQTPPETMHVIINEVQHDSWAIGGLLKPDRPAGAGAAVTVPGKKRRK